MISILLVVAAAVVLFGVDVSRLKALVEKAKTRIDTKTMIAAGLVLLAVLLLPQYGRDAGPTPVPDSGPVSLIGSFTGETASADAMTVGSLLLELADEVEYDGSLPEPSIRTGVQIDELRKAARLLRCRGESIGDRQPVARDKIAAYLETHIGTDGGPLTQQSRAAWVSAFREVGRAATDAAQ